MKKKLLLVLLVAVMVLAMIPVMATATDNDAVIDTEAELNAALAEGGEVVLGGNIVVNDGIKIPADKTVVLDLNGYTISQTKAQTAGYQMILNDGNLTINDTVGGGKISYTDSGNGGEYISDTIYNRGVLVINGGTIENISSETVASYGYPHAVDNYSGIRDISLTVNGGTIYCAEYSAIRMFCVSATNKADLVINDGTIKGAVDMQNGTKNLALGSLTVNGGTFETTKNANNIRFANWNGGATEYGITAAIKGGSFNGGFTTQYVPAAANWNKKIVSGGTFTNDVSEYLADGFEARDGEVAYYIDNEAELFAFAAAVNGGNTFAGQTVILTADIDLTGDVWTPIGTSNYDKTPTAEGVKLFAGNFDGGNHTITGLSSDGYVPSADETGSTEYSFGLFGYVYGANISNVKLANVNIDCGTRTDSEGEEVYGSGIAALVGYYVPANEKTSVISNCHVLGGAVKASNNMGGLIGHMDSQISQPNVDITIENCSNAADVTTEAREAGGILGLMNSAREGNYYVTMRGTVTFENCVNTGAITSLGGGAPSAGGILGRDHNQAAGQRLKVIFDDCKNSGTITVTANGETHAAGIAAGYYSNGAWLIAKDCENTGNVVVNGDGDIYAGGLISYGGVVELINSTSTGTVTGGIGNVYVGGAQNILFLEGMENFNDTVNGYTYYLNGGVSPEYAALVDDAAGGGNFHLVETAYKNWCEFGGWYDNADFTGEAYTTLSSSVKTYYAKWNFTATVIEIYDWEDLKELDALVESGNMLEGVTVKLMNDIDLYEMGTGGEPVSFNPIGANSAYFKGTFDGQGHTIKNMYQSGWALGYDWYNYGSIGLFAYLWNATVKNLTIENAECLVEGGNVAGIAGCAWGDCTFENITIKNSTYATYNNRAAGIVGYTGGEGTMTFKNVTVDEDTVIAALWGSYDCTLGGVVGSTQSPTKFHFENVTVECKLDCYNDVTASYKWYSYRMCGMLIGRMGTLQEEADTEVDPRGVVTLENVNITIGEWANHTYIFDDSLSKGCQRVEPGYAYGGVDVSQYPDAEVTTLGFSTIIGGPQSQSKGYYGSDITKLEALEGFEDQVAQLEVEDIALEIRRSAVAQIGDTYYKTFAEAWDAVQAGQTLTLMADVELSNILTIDKAITLDGNGHKLISTAGRAINVSGADGVTIKNLTIDCSGERAINVIQNATNVTINNVIATASNYTVNVAASAPNAVVAIKNSTLNGLCTVNVAAAGADVAVTDSTINCNDNNTTAGESYAALSLNKDATNGKIVATGCTINVAEGSDSVKGRNSATNGTVTINGSSDDVQIIVAIIDYPAYNVYHGFTTLENAIEFAKAGDIITLLADIELTAPITIPAGKTIILDLNGKTVTYNSTTQGEAMITNKGNLTINDSSDPDTGVINYNYTGAADSTYGKGNYTISNGGTLTVNGGKITIAKLSAHAKYPIDNNSTSGDAILVINGGHLYNYNTSAIRQFCNSTTYKNSVTINGGLIEGYSAIWMQNPGKNTVNGSLSITGGEIRTTAKAYVEGTAAIKDVSSKLYCTVEGGAWSADSAVSITGGIFNENVYLSEEAPVAVTIDKSNAIFNGKLELSAYVAQIGDTYYADLQEAIDAAQAGDTITLVGDVSLTAYITIDKSITLDLGEYDITRDGGTALYVNGDVNVTIKGETGKVTGDQALFVNKGLVKIYGGAFHGTTEAVYVINTGKAEIYGGTFSGSGTSKFVLNEYDKTRDVTSITVYGGQFIGFNPESNAAEGVGTNFVDGKFKAVEENGVYTVVDYIKWIKAELLAGRDVTLDRDIVLDDISYVEALPAASNGNGKYCGFNYGNGAFFNVIGDDGDGIIFDLNGHTITYAIHDDAWCNKRVVSIFYVTDKASLTIVDNSTAKTGAVTVNGMATAAYSVAVDTKVEIQGGKWTWNPCTTCGATNAFLYASHGGELYITGGSFVNNVNGDAGDYMIFAHHSSKETTENSAGVDYDSTKIAISGGTFENYNPGEIKYMDQGNGNAETMDDGCAEGFVPVVDENGNYGVKEWYDENATTLYINNIYELLAFAEAVNSGKTFKGQTVVLTADIDLAGLNWTPIGNDTNYFWGTFDGQDHTISNMTINVNTPDTNQFVGFFGGVRKATLKNFKLTNVQIDVVGAKVRAAAVVAIAHSNSENHTTANLNFENITVDGCVINAEAKSSSVAVGGLSGYCYPANMTNISVSNLTINPKASGSTFAGGLVGYMQGQNISNNGNTRAYYTVDTFNLKNITINSESDDSLIGGFAGYTYYGYITLKNATIDGFNVEVDVTKEALVGGLIGLTNRSDKGYNFTDVKITNIDFDITSDSGVDVLLGGMIGYSASPIAYSDCSVSGTITETTSNATSSAFVGGFVGGIVNNWVQNFTNCTADVEIEASTNTVGGFTGYNGTIATYTDCSSTMDPFIGYVANANITNNNSYVASVGSVYYANLANAIAAAKDGKTIVLLDNVVLEETIAVPADATVTLDLNGKTISMEDASGKTACAIKNNGNLTIKDSVGEGKITFNSTTPSANNGYASNTISNYGTITVESGTIENTTVGSACYALDNYAGSTANINGGKLVAEKTTVRIFNWTNGDAAKATLNISGGEILSKDGYGVNVNAGNSPAIAINISGGTITTEDTDYVLAVYIINKNSAENLTVNVTGGTMEGYFALNGVTSTTMKENAVSISGGTMTGVICYADPAYGFISGGTFGTPIDAAYCAEGFIPTENADGTYGVKVGYFVARVNGVGYETLAEALEAAKGEENIVIELLADATLDITAWDALAIGGDNTKTITINGNGNTLTFNKLNSDWSHITTKNDAKLILNNMTITDSGKNDGPWNRYDIGFACDVELNDVTSTKALAFKADATLNDVTINETKDVYAIWITGTGNKVAIDGLTVTSAGRGIKIDTQYNETEAATVELSISNATFTTANKAAIMVKSTAGANITASNVDITNVAKDSTNLVWNDSDNAEYFNKITVIGGTVAQEDVADFVAAIVDGSNNVVAYYKTFDAALAAAKAGENKTIVLYKTVEITADTTLDLTDLTIMTAPTAAGDYVDAFTILANVTVKGGTIDARPSHGYTFYVGNKAGVSGTLTIESGNFYGETSVVNNRLGTVTINGGYFEVSLENATDLYSYVINCIDDNYRAGTAKLVVNGGSFKNFNPHNNLAEGKNTRFTAKGYLGYEDDGVWTVAKWGTYDGYTIDNKDELIAFNEIANAEKGYNFSGKTVVLNADIDLDGMTWTPIKSFAGTFDGGNNTISNFVLDGSQGQAGFFMSLGQYPAAVKNLTLSDVTGTAGSERFAILAATGHTATVTNVHIKNAKVTTIHKDAKVGAIYGYFNWTSASNCTIENFEVDATAGAMFIGGFAGWMDQDLTMDNVDINGFKVVVSDTDNDCAVGGFTAQTQTGHRQPTFANCDVKGLDITATGTVDVGGFIADPGAHTIANNCTTEGKIDATGITSGSAGGFLADYGWNNNESNKGGHKFTNCSADVDIITKTAPAGGFVGSATNDNNRNMPATLSGCKATGTVTLVEGGTANIGGFAGEADRGTYTNCTATQDPFIGYVITGTGATITNNNSYVAAVNGVYYSNLANAIAAADNATVTLLADVELTETVKINGTVILDLNGHTITGTDNATKSFALIEIQPGAELTVNDTVGTGKITLTATNNREWNAYSSVISNQRGKLTVNGGTIEHLGGTDMAYGIDNLTNGKGTYAETVINGGTVKSTYRAIRQFLNGVEAQNILTINGGTIEGANKSVWMQDTNKSANPGTLTIGENATIKGDVYLFVTEGSTEWPVEISIDADALIDGSTVVTGNVPAGYDVANVNGVYGVYFGVAKIGDAYFATLANAIAAAVDGDTITLLDNVTLTETLVIEKSVTVDLNGYAVDVDGIKNAPAFRILSNVIFTNGEVNATDGINSYAFIVGNSTTAGTLTITSGSYRGITSVISITNGMAIISGGEFYTEHDSEGTNYGAQYLLNCLDDAYKAGKAVYVITGGKFVGFNPANNTAEGANTCFIDKATHHVTVNNSAWIVGEHVWEEATEDAPKHCDICGQTEGTALIFVAEVNGVKYETLQAAIDAAQDGETIVLLDNINIAEAAIQILGGKYNTLFRVTGKTVTIDMNNKVISGEYTGEAMLVGVFSTEENGHLTLTGNGTIDVTATTTVYGLIVCYEGTASITIENGTYTLDKAGDSLIYTGGNENITINGGTFTLGNVGTGRNGSPWIFNAGGQNTAHVIVIGGTFNADILHQHYPFEVSAPREKALKNNGDGTYTMVDAVAYVNEQHKSGKWYTNEVGFVTIEEAIAAALANVVNATEAGTVSTITLLKDVTLSEALSIEGITLGINLNGFTFGGEIVLATEDAVLVAPEGLNVTTTVAGKKVVYADGKYTANTCDYVAQIGDNKYESLADALAAVQNGDTIVILKDLTISGITVGHTTPTKVTIDLNGYTVTGNGSAIAFTAYRTGTVLTLKNGTITANTSGGTIKATYGGTLVLGDGLTVISGGQANAIVVDNGVLEVTEGATVTVDGGIDVIQTSASESNKVTITGGTFTGNMNIHKNTVCVITGGTFTVNVNDYCPTGYIAKDNGDGTWTVSEAAVAEINGESYSTLADALAAATAGDTIKLVDNVSESVVVISANVTLDLNGYTLTADYVASFGDIIDSANAGERTDFIGSEITKLGGGIVAQMDRVVIKNTNTDFAIYDSTLGGYRFFQVEIIYKGSKVKGYTTIEGAEGEESQQVPNQIQYGAAIKFANVNAYALIRDNATHGLEIVFDLDIGLASYRFAYDADAIKNWATKAYTYYTNPEKTSDMALTMTVSGLSAFKSDVATFVMTMNVATATGAEYASEQNQ